MSKRDSCWVEIQSDKGRAYDAWDAAGAHGCDDRTWMTLA